VIRPEQCQVLRKSLPQPDLSTYLALVPSRASALAGWVGVLAVAFASTALCGQEYGADWIVTGHTVPLRRCLPKSNASRSLSDLGMEVLVVEQGAGEVSSLQPLTSIGVSDYARFIQSAILKPLISKPPSGAHPSDTC